MQEPEPEWRSSTGEPDALKGASPVRREPDGKGAALPPRRLATLLAKLVVCVSMISRFYHFPWCMYEITEKIENRHTHDQYTFMKMPKPCSRNTTCSSGTSEQTRTAIVQTIRIQASSMWSANLLHPSFSARAFQRLCHPSVVMV